MDLENLSQQEIEALEQELLARVPEFGRIGNKSLRTQLIALGRWDAALYWGVRNNLIDRGLLVKGGGNGGSVRRPESTVETPPSQAEEAHDDTPEEDAQANERVPEPALYEPMAQQVIRDNWTKDFRLDSFVLEVTAHQGARPTGGSGQGQTSRLQATRHLPMSQASILILLLSRLSLRIRLILPLSTRRWPTEEQRQGHLLSSTSRMIRRMLLNQ